MKVIKTKDGSLTFHVDGKDNEYCLKYVETKKNGKKDDRENNVTRTSSLMELILEEENLNKCKKD